MFREDTKKLSARQAVATQMTDAAIKSANRVFSTWQSFCKEQHDASETLTELCGDISFRNSIDLRAKIESFTIDGDTSCSAVSSTKKTLHKLEQSAKNRIWRDSMELLLDSSWFVNFVSKLREGTKRLSTPIPTGSLKFLVVTKYIIVFGWKLDASLFYRIMELCVTDLDEHRKLIVHKILKAARDEVGISSESFLAYLESKNIQPCPELLSQIRAVKSKRHRHSRINSTIRPPTLGQEFILSSNNSGSLVAVTSATVTPRGGIGYNGGFSSLLEGPENDDDLGDFFGEDDDYAEVKPSAIVSNKKNGKLTDSEMISTRTSPVAVPET